MSTQRNDRQPCPKCPFRPHGLAYCSDGHDALADGHEPSCHMLVEAGMQFDDPMPGDGTICKGYEAWAAGVAGFVLPKHLEAV